MENFIFMQCTLFDRHHENPITFLPFICEVSLHLTLDQAFTDKHFYGMVEPNLENFPGHKLLQVASFETFRKYKLCI